jgi:hypothetical protein
LNGRMQINPKGDKLKLHYYLNGLEEMVRAVDWEFRV